MLKKIPPNTCNYGRYQLSWAEMFSYTHVPFTSWVVLGDMVLLVDLLIQVCRA